MAKERSFQRAFFAWWGALGHNGETIGDLFALRRAITLLSPLFRESIIVSDRKYAELACLGHPFGSLDSLAEARPDDVLFFVCGPIVSRSQAFKRLVHCFSGRLKIAIGVSVLPTWSPDYWQPFDFVMSRDGLSESIGDLAFSPNSILAPEIALGGRVGICLRGRQAEYGLENSAHQRIESLVETLMVESKLDYLELDTRLHGIEDAATGIIEKFAKCSLIITTRLHGALLSVAMGRPVVAIDQIVGGAKVSLGCEAIGLPVLGTKTVSQHLFNKQALNAFAKTAANRLTAAQKNQQSAYDEIERGFAGRIEILVSRCVNQWRTDKK